MNGTRFSRYQNPDRLDFGHYQVDSVSIEGEPADFLIQNSKAIIAKKTILDRPQKTVQIIVHLGEIKVTQ